jgi:5-methylcytosine-specific restriction endonuclease McrA
MNYSGHWRTWYGHSRWRKRRADQLRRHPLCAYCLKAGQVVAATVADHIIEHKGDYHFFLFGELQSLCKPHHDSNELDSFSKVIGIDGVPLDPSHPGMCKRDLGGSS